MTFRGNGAVLLSGIVTILFVFVAAAGTASFADEVLSERYALDIAASLPNSRAANIIQPIAEGNLGEAAVSTVSSVKGIVQLMRQAQEISAMLPSRETAPLPSPKTDMEIALDAAAHIPVRLAEELKRDNIKIAAQPASPRTKPKVTLPGSQELIWPVDGLIYSAFNATRGRRAHGAIDIVTKKGTPIAAVADGIVSVAAHGGKKFKGYGNIVILDHGGGLFTVYAHCDTLTVKMGQKVKQGDFIGTVGRTGRATTDHCHFEVRIAGKKHDPLAYLPSRPELLKATNYHTSPKKK
jgi:murein DD-endopeptidase MepM/ murein hydrolase activator NlpD